MKDRYVCIDEEKNDATSGWCEDQNRYWRLLPICRQRWFPLYKLELLQRLLVVVLMGMVRGVLVFMVFEVIVVSLLVMMVLLFFMVLKVVMVSVMINHCFIIKNTLTFDIISVAGRACSGSWIVEEWKRGNLWSEKSKCYIDWPTMYKTCKSDYHKILHSTQKRLLNYVLLEGIFRIVLSDFQKPCPPVLCLPPLSALLT